MNTITIAVEDENMVAAIRKVLSAMKGVSVLSASSNYAEQAEQKSSAHEEQSEYRISPRIKALETGLSLPQDISDDYKKEIAEIREDGCKPL